LDFKGQLLYPALALLMNILKKFYFFIIIYLLNRIIMELSFLDKKMRDIKTSYERQLNMSGRPGYDAMLTINLKKDFQILEDQKRLESFKKPFIKGDD
jgi:hypothetical protein